MTKAPTIAHDGRLYVQGFHWRDGWFFRREDAAGAVRIFHLAVPSTSYAVPPDTDADLVMDANSWASIVASVSAGGETGERFGAALRFHQGVE